MEDDEFWPQLSAGVVNTEDSEVEHGAVEGEKDPADLEREMVNLTKS